MNNVDEQRRNRTTQLGGSRRQQTARLRWAAEGQLQIRAPLEALLPPFSVWCR